MGIQVTPIPRLTTLATPAFTLGTANAAGDAITAVASNSTLLAFDATLPDAITLGQSGAVGSATVSSRRDHAHATASVTAASQAEMEAATSNTVFATPAVTQNSPGVAKAFVRIETDGTAVAGDYNTASVTDSGTGERIWIVSTDFAANTWTAVTGNNYDTNDSLNFGYRSYAVGQVLLSIRNTATNSLVDVANSNAGFGDQ